MPSEHIESIVGADRHETDHIGHAVSSEETFYILHSRECFTGRTDLRECPFSLALDHGINPARWPMDEPVRLGITEGRLTAQDGQR